MRLAPLILLALGVCASAQPSPFQRLNDHPLGQRTAQSNAALWGDVDADGDLDLYVSNTSRSDELWLNEGRGVFKPTTLGVSIPGTRSSGAFGDLDGDGDLDLVLSTFSGGYVLINDDLTWTAFALGGGSARDASLADVNGDARLDILLVVRQGGVNPLFLGTETGFQLTLSGDLGRDADDSVSSGWSDIDGDGDPDLYVTNTSQQRNRLYRNDGGVLVSAGKSEATIEGAYSGGSSWGDVDGDGDFDLFVVNQRNEGNRLYLNEGGRLALAGEDVIETRQSEAKSSAFGDVDNDGDLDLVVATKDGVDDLYLNRGDGTFDVVDLGTPGDGWAVGATLVDPDQDGDLDLFISHGANNTNDRNLVYRNRTRDDDGGGWLTIDLVGTASNRNAIGARVDVYATIGGTERRMTRAVESRTGRTAQSGFRLHVGMGDAAAADSVVIRWPSGLRQRLDGVSANQTLLVIEEGIATGQTPATTGHFSVGAPFPNPASGVVTIPVEARRSGRLTVDVIDARGRRVWAYVASVSAGERLDVTWPAHRTAFASGPYLVRVRSGRDQAVRSVTLTR